MNRISNDVARVRDESVLLLVGKTTKGPLHDTMTDGISSHIVVQGVGGLMEEAMVTTKHKEARHDLGYPGEVDAVVAELRRRSHLDGGGREGDLEEGRLALHRRHGHVRRDDDRACAKIFEEHGKVLAITIEKVVQRWIPPHGDEAREHVRASTRESLLSCLIFEATDIQANQLDWGIAAGVDVRGRRREEEKELNQWKRTAVVVVVVVERWKIVVLEWQDVEEQEKESLVQVMILH